DEPGLYQDSDEQNLPDVTFSVGLLASNNTSRESQPLLRRMEPDLGTTSETFPDDPLFASVVREAFIAIEAAIYPERIYQGSSGSYFVKNSEGKKIAVYKPKDEEPYGRLNPKWTKWMHKLCCPCCFGRSCLVPNQGYLSEAGASLVDQKLQLNIVPKTKASPRPLSETFNYSALDRAKARTKKNVTERFPKVGRHFNRIGLPHKTKLDALPSTLGPTSFPLHEHSAGRIGPHVFVAYNSIKCRANSLNHYAIRRKDRGNDNWLIRCSRPDKEPQVSGSPTWAHRQPETRIAAIDNGLAFPFKHPDSWRAYPYHWAWLPMAKVPFSAETRDLVLPQLSDMNFVQEMCDELHVLFKRDPGFDGNLFEKQMSVMRGQILNLNQALKDGKSPVQLVQLPAVIVERSSRRPGARDRIRSLNDNFIQSFQNKAPFFSWC
ncbi:phosphatidylinositol 4-kinase type-II, putative, partial [Ixodes scapularis]